jgi:hypothetical protein
MGSELKGEKTTWLGYSHFLDIMLLLSDSSPGFASYFGHDLRDQGIANIQTLSDNTESQVLVRHDTYRAIECERRVFVCLSAVPSLLSSHCPENVPTSVCSWASITRTASALLFQYKQDICEKVSDHEQNIEHADFQCRPTAIKSEH